MSSYGKSEDCRRSSQSPAAGPGRKSRDRWLRRAVIFIPLISVLFSLSLGMAAEESDYPHGKFEEDCSLCHTDEGWVPAVIQPEFDHEAASGFARRGAHVDLKCPACHTSLNFAEAPSECAGCHQDVHRGELGSDCDRCHGVNSFIDHGRMLRQHSSTRMPLTGRHRTADCESCHEPQPQGRLTWVNLPVDCYDCHREDYEGTTDPDHQAAGYPTDCSQCHTTRGWSRAEGHTGFPLTGAHRGLDCSACHAEGRYEGTPTDCYACHQGDYEGSTDPDHRDAGFSTDCTLCHNITNWDSDFDHSSWALTGSHSGLDCRACHPNGQYEGTPTDCYDCHRGDYEGQHDSGTSHDCTQCHNTSGWDSDFDHSGWPLTGAHRDANCSACHVNGEYEGTPTDCYACHQGDYEGSSDPDHQGAGFSTDCTLCHSTSSWDSDFDHSSWALTGAQTGLNCNACHANGQYEGTPTDCYACHREDYEGEHDSGTSHDCTLCHSTSSWDSDFEHSSWPLTGAHNGLDCSACHPNGQYEGTPTDCYACHRDDYEGSSDPDHQDAGFPNDCTLCHSTSNWDSNFNHSSWPLTGAHRNENCNACHANGQYEGTPRDCYTCHREEYEDEHGSGTSHNCEECHNTSGWGDKRNTGAGMSHEAIFPIYSGRHRNMWVSCKDCHPRAKNYSMVACSGCHDPSDHNRGRRKKNKDLTVIRGDGRACLVCHPRGESR